MRLGLIEAFQMIPDLVRILAAYPRRMRLGLIEARGGKRSIDDVDCGIRGACASASLKQSAIMIDEDMLNVVSEAHAPRPH